ncbi:MAG: MFS transporter [Propionibacteriaceae bacterium]
MSSFRRDLALLQSPDMGLLFTSRTLNALGMAFAPVALAFGLLKLPGGDEKLLSLVLAAEAIPLVVFLLVGGVIADRYPRRRVLIYSQLLATVAFSVLGWLIGTGHNQPVALCCAATLSGIGGAMGWPALSGLIPEIVPVDKRQQGNALLAFGVSTARMVGVVAGGFVTALLGGGWALAVSASMFAIAAISAIFLKAGREGGGSNNSMLKDLHEGWQEFISREWLWVIVAQWAFLLLCFSAAHAVLGPVIADRYLGGAKPWSIFLAAEAAGEVVGVMLALHWKPRRPILVPVVMTAVTVWIPFLLLAIAAPLPIVVATSVFMGVSTTFFNILWSTAMQQAIPAESLSRVSSYDAMGSMMFGPIGLLLAGPAAAWLGPRPAMFGCSILLGIIAAAALLSREVRTFEWSDSTFDKAA